MLYDFSDSLQERATIRRDRPRSCWMQLLGQVLKLGEGRADLVRHAERPWASATFSGVRHSITLTFEGAEGVAAGERLIAALGDHEFNIFGQIVADASVIEVTHIHAPELRLTADIELLLLEDL